MCACVSECRCECSTATRALSQNFDLPYRTTTKKKLSDKGHMCSHTHTHKRTAMLTLSLELHMRRNQPQPQEFKSKQADDDNSLRAFNCDFDVACVFGFLCSNFGVHLSKEFYKFLCVTANPKTVLA